MGRKSNIGAAPEEIVAVIADDKIVFRRKRRVVQRFIVAQLT